MLTWSTQNASTCTLTATPDLPAIGAGISCAGGSDVNLPSNDSPFPQLYTFLLTAQGAEGTSPASSEVQVTEEAVTHAPVSIATSEGGSTGSLSSGNTLSVTFDQAITVAGTFSVQLADGRDEGSIGNSDARATVSSTGTEVTFTLTGPPIMTQGSSLSLTDLEVVGATGVGAASGSWNLALSGVASGAGYTRVFGGSNTDMAAQVLAPSVYDVIPVATPDLPDAPEVITSCSPSTDDIVYDALTGAALSQPTPCGTMPPTPCPTLCPTSYAGLDYIPVPGLTTYEQVVVVQVPTGSGASTYVSSSGFAPQYTALSVSGNQVIFTYDVPVSCQGGTGTLSGSSPPAQPSYSQFKYYVPGTKYSSTGGNYTYADQITCPSTSGGTQVVAQFSAPVPSAMDFKYEGYGAGYFVVAGSASDLPGDREASQSAAGPAS